MININFQKVVALTLAFIVAFSSPAFATTAPAPTPTQSIPTIVKQAEDSVALSKTIVEVQDPLGKADSAASGNASDTGDSCINAVAKSINEAQSLIQSLIGDALATSNSDAANDKQATAKSLAKAETIIGNALYKILSCPSKLGIGITYLSCPVCPVCP